MPNILKAPAKVHAAKNFLKSFYDAGGADRIYIGLGNAGGEWSVPASPDVPIDAFQEEQDFWTNCIGMAEILQTTGTELVTLRKDFAIGGQYYEYDPLVDTGSGSFDTGTGRDFYVVNTEVNAKVYVCQTAGAGVTDTEPTHTDPTGSSGATNGQPAGTDGYLWDYLYTIGKDVSASIVTPTWVTVPTGDLVQAWPGTGQPMSLGDLTFGDGTGNFDVNTIYQCTAQTVPDNATAQATMVLETVNTYQEWFADQSIGAFYVACQHAFPDYAGTGNKINNVPYRQVALLRNPKDESGVSPILDARIAAPYHGIADGFQSPLDRGVVLTLDNRVTITRAIGQTETVRLILEF